MLARDLMNDKPFTVKPGDDLVSVGTMMYAKKKSGRMVVDDEAVVGILSKGGIVYCVKKACETKAEKLTVGDVMDKNFESVSPEASLHKILTGFVSMPYRIGRMPVLDDGRLVGEILKNKLVGVYADTMKGRYRVKDLMEYKPCFVYDYTSLGDVISELDASSEKKVLVKEGENVVGIITILDAAIEVFRRYKSGDARHYLDKVKALDIMTTEPSTIRPDEDACTAAQIMQEKGIGGVPVEKTDIEGILTKNDLIKGLKMAEEGIST